MACEIVSSDGGVFVLWGKPTKEDLDRVLERVQQTAAAAGHRIVFVARVPERAPAPDDEVRAYLKSIMARFFEDCSSYHAVLEGGGFVSAAKRAILIGLMQLGSRGSNFFVHGHVDGVLAKTDPSSRLQAQSLLSLAAGLGLLTAPPPEERSR
jgi:hypothetical protein